MESMRQPEVREQPGSGHTGHQDAAVPPLEAPDEQIAASEKLWVVVLAGGQGTRFRHFIRHALGSERPKQFCRIIGRRSMLRHTWDRAAVLTDPSRTVMVITAGQEAFLEEEAREKVPGTMLVQPVNRDTAPGLLLPLLWIAARDPKAQVAVFPSDHFVWEEARFVRHVHSATITAGHQHRVVLLGAEADGAEPSYGWIAPGPPVASRSAAEVYAVRRFWEKPDRRTAARLFACGYLWNTFVMAGSLDTFLRLAARHVPGILAPLRTEIGQAEDGAFRPSALRRVYDRLPPTNFSDKLLAHGAADLLVLAARDVYWNDWGDPDRIVRTLQRFGRQPTWLPQYAQVLASGPGSLG
jgi:mannose-1-phosphate guanylyltransferase